MTAPPSLPVPQANRVYQSAFGDVADGTEPPEWVDVRQDSPTPPSWLVAGEWFVTPRPDSVAGKVFLQQQTAPQPSFTMRRYAGDAFLSGDGAVPDVYTVSATLEPGDSPYYRSPSGEVALLLYFRDCRNYVQLVMTESNVALYEAIDSAPLVMDGWHGIAWYPVAATVGSVHALSAQVDTVNKVVRVTVDGQRYWPVGVPGLDATARHWVALRAAGNAMAVHNVTIDSRD